MKRVPPNTLVTCPRCGGTGPSSGLAGHLKEHSRIRKSLLPERESRSNDIFDNAKRLPGSGWTKQR